MAVRAESEGYDAVVLYCFSDPAVDACREVVSIPVVGGGQASCLLAPLVAGRPGFCWQIRHAMRKSSFLLLNAVLILRVLLQSAALRPVVLICGQSVSVFWTCLWKPAKIAGGRQSAGTAFGLLILLGLAHPLSERLGVPVVDPAVAPVALAECLVRQGLKTSRKAYPAPPLRKRTWQCGQL